MAPLAPDPGFARSVDAHGVAADLEKMQQYKHGLLVFGTFTYAETETHTRNLPVLYLDKIHCSRSQSSQSTRCLIPNIIHHLQGGKKEPNTEELEV